MVTTGFRGSPAATNRFTAPVRSCFLIRSNFTATQSATNPWKTELPRTYLLTLETMPVPLPVEHSTPLMGVAPPQALAGNLVGASVPSLGKERIRLTEGPPCHD